jgi:RNA polymerase sigma-70 factor (ECF subfamily)
MEETQSSLLRRVGNRNDIESWREFVALYEPLLVTYIRSKGLQESDARDVVQEVFVKLHRAMPGFELDRSRGRFRTWLWQVSTHAIADWARRHRRREGAEEGWRDRLESQVAAPEPEPDQEWITSYRKRVLGFTLERVRSQSQRRTWECFEQHVLKGRPSAEVAAELGLTANAVNVNASRVLARVREQCAEYMEELADE